MTAYACARCLRRDRSFFQSNGFKDQSCGNVPISVGRQRTNRVHRFLTTKSGVGGPIDAAIMENTMPVSKLFGPHALNEKTIDQAVRGVGAGAYALGRVDQSGTFLISYVGRSDSDLNSRIKQHAGKYQSFKYAFYQGHANAAFLAECRLFHDFGAYSLDNKVHPARPQGSSWKCPHCTMLD